MSAPRPVRRAWTNASIGPLPSPTIVLCSPFTSSWAVIVVEPLFESLRSSWLVNEIVGSAGRYSVRNESQITSALTSVPVSSVTPWMTWLNSIWSRRGRSKPCSSFITYATPPLPDWLLTRMTFSYVRPTCFGSIGRYGTPHLS